MDSALDILNRGLNADQLTTLQSKRKVQLGQGWYATTSDAAAWYFASIAPGNAGKGFTVIELEIFVEHLELLIEQELAKIGKIVNVLFDADQYRFNLQAFEFLNEHAVFRPHKRQRS